MNEKWIFTALIVGALVGCGKSGGSDDVTERPSGSIVGTAFDGLITNGEVKVTSLDGHIIGSATTDDKGIYEIDLNSVPSQPLKIEISSGTYKEEYSAQSVVLKDGKKMSALINYEQGTSISTSITYFTTVAAGLAEYKISSGLDPKTAIDESNVSVSSTLGLDILRITPVDITNAENVTPQITEGQIYGYFTSSISAYTGWVSEAHGKQPHELYNSISFSQYAYDDVRFDGKLDGIGSNGAIAMGKIQFSPDTYRYELALNMLVMANHENNKLGYTPVDVSRYSKILNESANPIFAGAEIKPLNTDGTLISNASWVGTDAFFGDVSLSVTAFDVVGVIAAKLTINGVNFTANNFERPTFEFDSSQFSDGTYEAIVSVTNATDVVTEFKQSITFANRATMIVTTNPVDGQAVGGVYDFGASVADPFGVDRVTFIFDDTITMDALDSNLPVVKVDTKNTLGSEGKHRLVVRASGRSGYEAIKEINFVIDNTPPTVESNLGDGAFVSSVYTLTTTVNDNLGVKSASVKIDGREIQSITDRGSYTVPFDPQAYSEGPHTLVIEVFDRANNRTVLTRNFTIDRNPPTINITTPSGTVVSAATNIIFEASDTLGFGANKTTVSLKGYPVPLATLDSNVRSFRLDPFSLFWGEGNATVELTVIDGSGKAASDSIIVNFQHIGTSAKLVTSGQVGVPYQATCYPDGDGDSFPCTKTRTYTSHTFGFDWASGTQVINSLRFNGAEVKSTYFNSTDIPWTPGQVISDPTRGFTIYAHLTPLFGCRANVGTLEWTITDGYGITTTGSVANFRWCTE